MVAEMRNRISRSPLTRPSARYLKEQRARYQATRDPHVLAMYQSKEWQGLRALVKREAHYRCQWPDCDARGMSVDHREPHKGNTTLFFSRANLWLLCKRHHDKKTARFDGGFGNARRPLPNEVTIWPSASAAPPPAALPKKSEGGGFGFA